MRSAVLAASALAFLHAGGPRIHDIQGPTHRSPWVDQDVSGVTGVVTQLGSHGFYMQDPEPDDDDATSEGIRVDVNAAVRVGDQVDVSGTVRETRPGCAGCGPSSDAYANLTTTEIAEARVVVVATAMGPPEPVRLGGGPGGRRPPVQIVADAAGDVEGASIFDPSRDGIDFYESVEGMLVEVDGARVVGPTARPRGRPRELVVVPGGAGFGPSTSNGGLLRAPGDDNPERITVVHEGLPDLDVGDGFTEPIVGVVDYDFGRFNLVAARVPSGFRPFVRTASPPLAALAGDALAIATFNVENLAPSSASRMDDIAGIIAGDLGAPDVVVLQEIQDDSGPADDGATSAARTYAMLIGAIVSRGGPRYDWRDVAPADGDDGGGPGETSASGFSFATTAA